jgi:hypothetical protein
MLVSVSGFSQKGDNVVGVGGDLSFPMGDFGNFYKTGFGIYGKGMLGVGKAGHVTLTTGYTGFKVINNWEGVDSRLSLTPLLIGYRHSFNGFFIEPEIGYEVAVVKISADELPNDFTDSKGFFSCAAVAGYVFNKQLEISARYQVGAKDAGHVNVFGLQVGYNFSLGHSKK